MGAYKKLNKQDAYITTYTAHKEWAVSGSDLAVNGITVNLATGDYLNSMQQNYYPPKDNGISPSHSFDPSYQTTLDFPQARNLITGSAIISVPRELYGVAIKPKSVIIDIQPSLYVQSGYWNVGYTDPIDPGFNIQDTYEGFDEWDVGYTDDLATTYRDYIYDDGEGNLFEKVLDPLTMEYTTFHIGDIIYNQGMIIITSQKYSSYIARMATIAIWFKSTVPILTHNYHCKLRESEFNFTYNPSAVGSVTKTTYDNLGDIYNSTAKVNSGELKNNVTGSDFQPYITTVGLYNDAHELIAVGKMGQPVPKSANTDMTFVVKIDI
jgi:hypothetical protein